jgi:hypothetical protein
VPRCTGQRSCEATCCGLNRPLSSSLWLLVLLCVLCVLFELVPTLWFVPLGVIGVLLPSVLCDALIGVAAAEATVPGMLSITSLAGLLAVYRHTTLTIVLPGTCECENKDN